MLTSNRVEIDQPKITVFGFLRIPENLPLWNYYVQEVRKISRVDEEEKYLQIRKNDQQVIKFIDVDAPDKIIIATVDDANIRFHRTLKLTASGDNKTLLTDNFELDLRKPGFIQQLFRSSVRSAVKENLFKLKQLLETGQTVLQDGRVSTVDIKN